MGGHRSGGRRRDGCGSRRSPRRSRKRSRGRGCARNSDRGNGRRRSNERGSGAPRNLKNLGNHGSGDHRQDVDEFISVNELNDKTAEELRSCDESVQKKVMGTDGGVHLFQLLGKVRSPDAVVWSRIRKEKG